MSFLSVRATGSPRGHYRPRVKFCGITRIEDALAAAALGVDALGFVFTARSRRCVDLDAAVAIRRALPPFVTSVALFMDEEAPRVRAVIDALAPDLLQFHGNESPDYCAAFGRPYLKAVGMADAIDLAGFAKHYPHASGFLLDSHAAGAAGGTGATFDWLRVPRNFDRPLLLAGGLHAGNVADALRAGRPYGVDVSSGIEAFGNDASGAANVVTPGIKDHARMFEFIQEVTRVSAQLQD